MNSVLWILAGCAVGWLAYSYFDKNTGRGLFVAILIGGGSAFFGGKVIGPIVGADISPAGDFNLFAFVLSISVAVAAITIADEVSDRFDV